MSQNLKRELIELKRKVRIKVRYYLIEQLQ